jgi:hypothetical protein
MMSYIEIGWSRRGYTLPAWAEWCLLSPPGQLSYFTRHELLDQGWQTGHTVDLPDGSMWYVMFFAWGPYGTRTRWCHTYKRGNPYDDS